MNITVLNVDGFQTCFGSAASAFGNIHCALKDNFSVTLKGFTCMCFTDVENYLCTRSQLNTKYKTEQLIRFTRRTETMTDLKSGSNKTAATL